MNSDIMNQVLNTIDQAKGGAKELILADYGKQRDFTDVLRYALDPYITYGVAKLAPPNFAGEGGECFDDRTWDLLHRLARRELSGNAAKAAIETEMLRLTHPSRELLTRILLKDLRCGVGASTVNKAVPGLIPVFKMMKAEKLDAARLKFPVAAEFKLDGFRATCIVQGSTGTVAILSRNGLEYPAYAHFKEPLLKLVLEYAQKTGVYDWVVDVEAISGSFAETASAGRKKTELATDTVFHVFDMLPLCEFESGSKQGCGKSLYARRGDVVSALAHWHGGGLFEIVEQRYLLDMDEVNAMYAEAQERGLEGLMLKDPDSLYHKKKCFHWMKMKPEESEDLIIIDSFEGTGKYAGQLGGVVVDFNGVPVRVGGGFSDAVRVDLWDDRSALIGRMIEVAYMEVTPDGSLRHPRYKRFRDTLEHGVKE